MRTVAVIPARGGSRGVPGKNLAAVGGLPLVARTVRAARAAARVDAVFVSSDDPAILAAGAAHGAHPIERPAALSGDDAGSEAALLHALDAIGGPAPERLVFLQCTSPFTTPAEIDALVAALDDERFACALTVTPDHGFLWRPGPDGARGINHDEQAPRRRRQELEPAFRETGAGYAMRVDAFRRAGSRFCGPVALVEVAGPPLEIDTPADLDAARALARAQPSPPPAPAALAAIRALVTDFDGVHTDDAVIVSQEGIEHVRASRRDGLGIERLRKSGLPILVLSKEVNPVVARRAEKLKLPVIHGQDDKLPVLRAWAAEQGLPLDAIAYVGNDVNDLPCMVAAGLSFAPSDSHPAALDAADHVLAGTGGNGALRELADLILAARVEAAA